MKDYEKAISLDPENSGAYKSRGDAFNALKKFGLALNDYNTAISFDPENANAYHGRGTIIKTGNNMIWQSLISGKQYQLILLKSFYVNSLGMVYDELCFLRFSLILF